MFWIPATIYQQCFNGILTVLAVWMMFRYSSMPSGRILQGSKNSWLPALLLAVFAFITIGFRAPFYFGDSYYYYINFLHHSNSPLTFTYEAGTEYGWMFLYDVARWVCAPMSKMAQFEFLLSIVAVIYVGGIAIACYRILPRHAFLAMLFVMTCFSFFSYGVNGMRNGVGTSLVLVAMSFLDRKLLHQIIALIICCVAYTFHHSTALPSLCMFLSFYFLRGPKWCIFFWIASILISLITGNAIADIFASMGFDDRMSGYLQDAEQQERMEAMFSKVGFRWDFLLYSSVPIIVGWYTVMKLRIGDRIYKMLLNTYILSNAFWVMVIRASFSNRFAYLSWFMYGLVLLYPLVRFRVFEKQGAVIAALLLYQVVFLWLI